MAKKKTRKSSDNLRGIRESMEVPGVAENPSSATVAKQIAKHKAIVVFLRICAFGLVPVMVMLAAVAFVEATSAPPAPPKLSSHTVNGAGGKAAAINELKSWLNSDPAPLPNGEMVSWDGYSEREAPEPLKADEEKPTYIEQSHYFTVRAGNQIYDSQVLVLVDGNAGVKTVDTPSLLPRPTESTSNWKGETPWFGYRGSSPSEAVTTAIEAWADAYVSGSPKLLKQVTGDRKDKRSYVPLSGAEGVTVEVTTTAVLAPKTLAEDETWKEPNRLIARVELLVHWAGEKAPEPGDHTKPITFDLLVTDTHSANAKVVSWGGVGSGPSLTPYSVGLNGVSLKEPNANDLEVSEETGAEGGEDEAPSDEKAEEE